MYGHLLNLVRVAVYCLSCCKNLHKSYNALWLKLLPICMSNIIFDTSTWRSLHRTKPRCHLKCPPLSKSLLVALVMSNFINLGRFCWKSIWTPIRNQLFKYANNIKKFTTMNVKSRIQVHFMNTGTVLGSIQLTLVTCRIAAFYRHKVTRRKKMLKQSAHFIKSKIHCREKLKLHV